MNTNDVTAWAEKHGFTLEKEQGVLIDSYMDILLHWNKVMNLVGAVQKQELFETLIVDSLHLAHFLDRLPLVSSPICWDLGAGAGLPGIPLRTIWQRGQYWLVESREKRALFLQTVLARLFLKNTHVFHGRAEHFMSKHGNADLIVSRAFMPWRELLCFVRAHLNTQNSVQDTHDITQGRLATQGQLVLLLRENVTQNMLTEHAPEWRIVHSAAYHVGDITRYFFSLALKDIENSPSKLSLNME